MKPFIKSRLTYSTILLILANLVPLWGVWFREWDAKQVFIIYCLESVIMGGYNVLMMVMTTLVKKKDVWQNGGASSVVSGYWFILFFMAHYGFFLFIQISIFLEITGTGNFSFGTNFFHFITHVTDYISPQLQWVLLLFIASYGLMVLKDFVFTGIYKTVSLGGLLFLPYARIFVQQFCVIIGAFVLALGAGKIFILIFVLVKIFFETILDFRSLLVIKA